MKSSLLSAGSMVGLPKSCLEPGRVFTSRKDGPTHVLKSGNCIFKSLAVSAS